MRVTESVDDRIGIVITGAAVPAGEPRVRAELDHAERNDRAGKRVTVSGGADERIDVTREICAERKLRRGKNNDKAKRKGLQDVSGFGLCVIMALYAIA